MRYTFLILTLLWLSLASCQQDDLQPTPAPNPLLGTWHQQNPTLGFTWTYQFTADSLTASVTHGVVSVPPYDYVYTLADGVIVLTGETHHLKVTWLGPDEAWFDVVHPPGETDPQLNQAKHMVRY